MKPGRVFQSTHSLRSATHAQQSARSGELVSIHALLAECDFFRVVFTTRVTEFQSTHSLRSATSRTVFASPIPPVSIHALLAECDMPLLKQFGKKSGFNPRTPCGVRPWCLPEIDGAVMFQSTHSLRSATWVGCEDCSTDAVSIHALLAECDGAVGETSIKCRVSIHALLAECDHSGQINRQGPRRFNPRTPCGVRRD